MRKTKEENKKLFIYSLKSVAKKEAVSHLSFFLRFITENIKSKSGEVRVAVINMTRWVISSLPQPLNKEEEKMICRFIDRIIDMMDEHYKEEFSDCEHISDLPPSVYKSLQILVSRVVLSQEYYRKIYEKHLHKIPPFIDCSWKREFCGDENCPMCAKGKSIEDAPVVEEDGVYRLVGRWNEEVFTVAEEAEEDGDFWMFTRAACDLFWYSGVLQSKCSILTKSEPLSFENNYARYVARECLKIIENSLKEIIIYNPVAKSELKDLLLRARKIEKKILDL